MNIRRRIYRYQPARPPRPVHWIEVAEIALIAIGAAVVVWKMSQEALKL